MNHERLNAKQTWFLIVLLVACWIPITLILLLESSGVLNFSNQQLAVIGVVNLIVVVPAAVFASRKWIHKVKN